MTDVRKCDSHQGGVKCIQKVCQLIKSFNGNEVMSGDASQFHSSISLVNHPATIAIHFDMYLLCFNPSTL